MMKGGMLMENENAALATVGQMLELGSSIIKNMPRDMPADICQGWIKNPRALQKMLRERLLPPEIAGRSQDTPAIPRKEKRHLAKWEKFWATHGIECDLSGVVIPAKVR